MNTAPTHDAAFHSYAVQRTGADSWRELIRTYISTGVRSTTQLDRRQLLELAAMYQLAQQPSAAWVGDALSVTDDIALLMSALVTVPGSELTTDRRRRAEVDRQVAVTLWTALINLARPALQAAFDAEAAAWEGREEGP